MLKQLTHTQVWVHDQDEALAFYTEKLGMELREDVTVPELGNFRWLSVGVPGQPEVSITLMAVPGPPVFDEDTRAKIQELLAPGGRALFSSDDVQGSYEELKSRGSSSPRSPRSGPTARRRVPRLLREPLPDDLGGLGASGTPSTAFTMPS